MKKATKSYRRRDLMSYPRAQIKIISIFAFIAVVFAGVNGYVSTNALQKMATNSLNISSLSPTARSDIGIVYAQEALTLRAQLALLTFLAFFVFGVGSVYISHKIAGPIHRLNSYLAALSRGEIRPTPLRFRRFDFFLDVTKTFNDFQRAQGMIAPEGESAGTPADANGPQTGLRDREPPR